MPGSARPRRYCRGVPYDVRTPVFEGPFDLLLHLITKEQVDVYEVSLSAIVEAYIEHLDVLERLDLEVATEFLLIAATLVELKARRLLPDRHDLDPDEELSIWDERDVLLARLVECKTFKDAGRALERLLDEAARSQPRVAGIEERFLSLVPDVLAGVTPGRVRAACLRALTPTPPPRVTLDHVAPVQASVTDAVAELRASLPGLGRATFREMTVGVATRIECIVRFLALLELYKDGVVDLDQAEHFGDLRVTWLGVGEEALAP